MGEKSQTSPKKKDQGKCYWGKIKQNAQNKQNDLITEILFRSIISHIHLQQNILIEADLFLTPFVFFCIHNKKGKCITANSIG